MTQTAIEVGWLFVQEFYTFLNRDPSRLHCFYNKKSSLSHGIEGEQPTVYNGQQEIHQKITDLNFNNCKVLVSNVDALPSLNGGIIVQVLGEMSNNGGASHKFAQTFFLAEQPNGYYVLNDIFRFLKEDIDNQYEDTPDPAINGAAAMAPAPSPKEKTVPSFVEASPVAVPQQTASPKKQPSKPQGPVVEATVPMPMPSPPKKETPVAAPQPSAAAVVKEPIAKPSSPVKEEKKVEQPAAPQTKPKTPAVQQTVQKPAQPTHPAPAQPAAPPKPKTWANLAASNVEKFEGQLAAVQGSVMSTKPQKPIKGDRQPRERPQTQQQSESTATAENDKDFKTVSNRKGGDKQNQQGAHDRERMSVYVRIPEGTSEKDLQDAFSAFGTVRKVDMLPNKSVAFVEFTELSAATDCIGKTVEIKGTKITAEERKKRSGGGNGNRGGNGFDRKERRGGDKGSSKQ